MDMILKPEFASFDIVLHNAPTWKYKIEPPIIDEENFFTPGSFVKPITTQLMNTSVQNMENPSLVAYGNSNENSSYTHTPNTMLRGKFNIAAAVEHLRNNSTAKSRHICAKAVRKAMEAGGLSTSGRPGYGGAYIPYLQKTGWEIVNDEPQAGDIAVTVPHGSHKYGHISMYDGNQWISDFRQRSKYVYKTANDENTKVLRYRG